MNIDSILPITALKSQMMAVSCSKQFVTYLCVPDDSLSLGCLSPFGDSATHVC